MRKLWRLILDGKADGYLNMAKDEDLSLAYIKENIPTLRIYGWDKPFITIGYNQKPDKVIKPSSQLPYTRRITGGASIIHDKELTYSLVCSYHDLALPKKVKESYKILTSFLLAFYQELGLKANFVQDIASSNISRYENFCFASYEPYDIIIQGKKIGGNAQRRKHDIIFQHGSIPQVLDFSLIEANIIGADNLGIKTTFLDQLLGLKTDYQKLQNLLISSFSKTFGVDFL